MPHLTVADIVKSVPGSQLRAEAGTSTARLTAVSTDSRAIEKGALFVALRGARFDGHDYCLQAVEKGAAAVLVERALDALPAALPQIVVPDAKRALGLAAAGWRARFDLPVIAVTGSNGKTTVTQMIGAILAVAYGDNRRLVTRGNLNNEIGLPLMMFELAAGHRAAVFELGMNHPGEITLLAQLARPTVGLVNNAQREHQEFMASVEATAHENGAVIAALPAAGQNEGVAVFPADDGCAAIWRELAGGRRIFDFARHGPAAVTAQFDLHAGGADLSITTPMGVIDVELGVAGEHNVHNALAATAAALAIGVPPASIKSGLAGFRAVTGRGEHSRLPNGATLIDDAYNANPDSVRAAIDVLAQSRSPRVLVLGDMGEVGTQGPEFHREIGAYARARRVDVLLALGRATADTVAAFGKGGQHFSSIEPLLAAVRAAVTHDATVLVKGSRFMRMERVVAALTHKDAGKDRTEAH